MTADRNSEAMARLRAAAPATGDVDLAALRARVETRRAEGGARSVAGHGAEQPVDELAARRRRGMTGSGWAAAAAAAVIFGGGGLLLGSGGLGEGLFGAAPAGDAGEDFDTAVQEDAEPEAEVFAEPDENGDEAADDTAGSDDAADEEDAPAPMQDEVESGTEVLFLASELSAGPSTAAAWQLQVDDADAGSAELLDLGEVELISPEDAVEMLNDPSMGARIDPVPPGPPGTQAPGGILTIADAELTWQTYENADGSLLLVPAYALTDSQEQIWNVLAVAELSDIE